MRAYYYYNGAWTPYSSGKEFITNADNSNVSFKFISLSTGKETVANGSKVNFNQLGISKPFPGNVSYFKRIGSSGPSLFAVDFTDTTNLATVNTTELEKEPKSLLWMAILGGIGYFVLR